MNKVLLINTGGTFNKIYNPLTGNLDIDAKGSALYSIANAWLTELDIINIIAKDSLEMTNEDRLLILKTIQESNANNIIIVHGTDTIEITAAYLSDRNLEKTIVLTGAMCPFSVNPLEATANVSSAYGFLQGVFKYGVYISMNGKIELHQILEKNRERGYFEMKELHGTTT